MSGKISKSKGFLFSAICLLLGILIKIYREEITLIPAISYYSALRISIKVILLVLSNLLIVSSIIILNESFNEKSSKKRK
tara:strand:- start:177 stop:416 length:240 start_codon:yes stop_codon:yes gene_type:complete